MKPINTIKGINPIVYKKTVGEFCNYVANHYKIDLNLEPIESEDEGELLVDFNTKHTDNAIQDIFKQLNLKGEIKWLLCV